MSITAREQNGSIDEIVATRCRLHLEQMDDSTWVMEIESGKKSVLLSISASGGRYQVQIKLVEEHVDTRP